MSDILVFGATGFLGTHLQNFLNEEGLSTLSVGRAISSDILIDIFDKKLINHTIKKFRPEIIVNLVANTNVDWCENYFSECVKVNTNFVANLCEAINQYSPKTHLIHISTDHVYGASGPHAESNISLINSYAISKYLGEKSIEIPSYTILRTNFFGKNHVKKNSFSDWIVNSLINNQTITLFNDVYFSPLHVTTLVRYIHSCMYMRPQGVYNLGSINGLSKADCALKLISKLNLPTQNILISSVDSAQLLARRPKDMRMNCEKIKMVLGEMPCIESQISLATEEYANVE